jgi:hypothetical protein
MWEGVGDDSRLYRHRDLSSQRKIKLQRGSGVAPVWASQRVCNAAAARRVTKKHGL